MDFSIPDHQTNGLLHGEDLVFFYYVIGQSNLECWLNACDWDAIVSEFKGKLDIESCLKSQIPKDFELNKIRFNMSESKNLDNCSKAAAFFRHLRNAFSHYRIGREGENYVLTDCKNGITMRGLVNAELLKDFCFKFMDMRDQMYAEIEAKRNPTL